MLLESGSHSGKLPLSHNPVSTEYSLQVVAETVTVVAVTVQAVTMVDLVENVLVDVVDPLGFTPYDTKYVTSVTVCVLVHDSCEAVAEGVFESPGFEGKIGSAFGPIVITGRSSPKPGGTGTSVLDGAKLASRS